MNEKHIGHRHYPNAGKTKPQARPAERVRYSGKMRADGGPALQEIPRSGADSQERLAFLEFKAARAKK